MTIVPPTQKSPPSDNDVKSEALGSSYDWASQLLGRPFKKRVRKPNKCRKRTVVLETQDLCECILLRFLIHPYIFLLRFLSFLPASVGPEWPRILTCHTVCVPSNDPSAASKSCPDNDLACLAFDKWVHPLFQESIQSEVYMIFSSFNMCAFKTFLNNGLK